MFRKSYLFDDASSASRVGGKLVVMAWTAQVPEPLSMESKPDGILAGVSGVTWSSDGRYVFLCSRRKRWKAVGLVAGPSRRRGCLQQRDSRAGST